MKRSTRSQLAGFSSGLYRKCPLEITIEDRAVLRTLCEQLGEAAANPREHEKRELWYHHNELGDVRPVVFCDPEEGWAEIIPDEDMRCEGDLAREWEWRLRTELFWACRMGDDRPVESVFDVEYAFDETDWGMSETIIGGGDGGAYTWESPLKSYDDLDKLRFPETNIDWDTTRAALQLAREVMGEFLNVRLNMRWFWGVGLTATASKLRGLEQIMLDMYENPGGLHALMAFLRDGTLNRLDFLENNGLLHLNNDSTYVGSGGLGYTRELPSDTSDGRRVRLKDMWGNAESQETCCVSSAMFAEFVFPYQLPILERFGLNCYGCCEALNGRWDVIKTIPNLRRVSVSPWADIEDMAAKLGDKYIFSLKPSPTQFVTGNIDEQAIRRWLRDALEKTKGCRLEMIVKDTNNFGGNPGNLVTWCGLAKEEIERLY